MPINPQTLMMLFNTLAPVAKNALGGNSPANHPFSYLAESGLNDDIVKAAPFLDDPELSGTVKAGLAHSIDHANLFGSPNSPETVNFWNNGNGSGTPLGVNGESVGIPEDQLVRGWSYGTNDLGEVDFNSGRWTERPHKNTALGRWYAKNSDRILNGEDLPF